MAEKITVPTLGESVTEATVSKWLKNEGDSVEADEPIVELETDKVNLEVPSPISGILTEINSTTATTAVFLPVLAGLSKGADIHPFLLMVPATIAASCAFMLPSGTGPNASVLASGKLSIPQMAKVGFGLNILAVAFITILVYLIILPVFGISDSPPSWVK